MTNKVDENGRKVLAFSGKVQNLSRVAELLDAFTDIAESGAWRDYTTATGRETWRESEFDYFLIAEDVRRDDAARVLAHNKKAKELAPLMDPNAAPRNRRPFHKAATEWNRLNISLIDRAHDLGWLKDSDLLEFGKVSKDAVLVTPLTKRARGQLDPARKWQVNYWLGKGQRPLAELIVEKLLADPDLARDVYNKLEAKRVRTRRADKRRSAAQNVVRFDRTGTES